jgi:hypothetical protein
MNTYYTGMWIPARPMGLMVNDTVITRVLNFTATGNSDDGGDPWSVWADLPITVQLNAGVNTIELFATDVAATGANPHVDSMTVTPVDAGVLPDAPTYLTVSAGVGTVDLYWEPSAIATSYNVYRSTSSGSETLVASGVTAPYFFDSGLAGDGTSYFYQVSTVNSAGESAFTDETSATPTAPAGLVFSDDFSNGPSPAWVFTPDMDYWLPQIGQLTDATGDTVANVPQTATVALPAGAGSWQADLLTKEGYGAATDEQGNPGISGLSVQSTDGLNAVFFSVFDNFTVNVGTTVNGVFQGYTRVGVAAPFMHPSGPEMLWHTYDIRLDPDGTFSVLFDGNALASGINAGPASAWTDGIGMGTLFTMSNLDDRHLSTFFDNVRSFGLSGAADLPSRGRAAAPLLSAAIALSLTDAGVSNGTIDFHQGTAVDSPDPRGSSNELLTIGQAMLVAPEQPDTGQAPRSSTPARATNTYHRINGDGETLEACFVELDNQPRPV